MQIIIEYESSWRNSFLSGDDNRALKNDDGSDRKYIASNKVMDSDPQNYIERSISKNTVMGILNRLIGEQRKLHNVRISENYYFKNIEDILTDKDIVDEAIVTQEIVFLRNISGSTDRESFSGMIKANHKTFNSEYSKKFWGVLWLDFDSVMNLILNSEFDVDTVSDYEMNPIEIVNRSNILDKLKPLKTHDMLDIVLTRLSEIYPDIKYLENNGSIKIIRFYAAALYIQLDRLKEKYDMSSAVNKRGKDEFVFGYSKRGFNSSRDFMKNFITGGEKIVWGNPYIATHYASGSGKEKKLLNKANGKLTINLNISKDQARDLEEKIENAGVSSFYLGKKGLAYVTDIR